MNQTNQVEFRSNESSIDPDRNQPVSLARPVQFIVTNGADVQQKKVDEKLADFNSRDLTKVRPLLEYISQQRLEARMNNTLTRCIDSFLLQLESLWFEIKNSIRSDYQSLEEAISGNHTNKDANPQVSELELQYTRIAENISDLTAAFSGKIFDEVKQMISLKANKRPAEIGIIISSNQLVAEANLRLSSVSPKSEESRRDSLKEEEDHVFKNNINALFDAVANESAVKHDESILFKSREPTGLASSKSSLETPKDNISALPKPGAKLLKEFPAIQNPKIQDVLVQAEPLKIDLDESKNGICKKGETVKIYPPMVLENGDVYEGGWLLSTKHGFGKILSFSGFFYEGEWKNDLAHGKGRLINVNGDVYEGGWINGKYHGQGVFKSSNGYSYQGEWSHDMQHGFGREDWADGSYYEGEYKWSKKHGRGTFKWANGESYTGQFCLNNMHGQGIYGWPDGKTFAGVWRENKVVAEGSFDSPRGRKESSDKLETIEEEDLRVVLTSPNCVMMHREGALNQRRTSSFSLLKICSAEKSTPMEIASDIAAHKENHPQDICNQEDISP